MSIHHNGHGRSYARCDAKDCDANVIDLPLDAECAARVVRTFFLWQQTSQNSHECPLHRLAERRRRGTRYYPRGWKRVPEESLK